MMVKIIDTSDLRRDFPNLGGLDTDYSNNDFSRPEDVLEDTLEERFEQFLEDRSKRRTTFNNIPISKKRAKKKNK
jgi:hypothetical protein